MTNKWIKRLFPSIYVISGGLFAVGVLVVLFSLRSSPSQTGFEPRITVIEPTVQCRLVETHTVRYVDRPVTVVEQLERVKRIPVELRNYKDLEELKQWLVEVNTNRTTIYFQQPDVTIDCDDFALALQQKALADGYVMSFQIIEPTEYNSRFKSGKMPADTLHAINLAIIGNDAYYIEPQTGEVVFAAHLD